LLFGNKAQQKASLSFNTKPTREPMALACPHELLNSIWYKDGIRWRVVGLTNEHVKLETCHKQGDKPAGTLCVKQSKLQKAYTKIS
jgi:hypothetical protein